MASPNPPMPPVTNAIRCEVGITSSPLLIVP
jgi:hypothetical protein